MCVWVMMVRGTASKIEFLRFDARHACHLPQRCREKHPRNTRLPRTPRTRARCETNSHSNLEIVYRLLRLWVVGRC